MGQGGIVTMSDGSGIGRNAVAMGSGSGVGGTQQLGQTSGGGAVSPYGSGGIIG